jgi:Do/DeqQ family serine protease
MKMNNQLKSYAIIALMSSGVTLGAYSLFNLGNNSSGFSDAPSAFTTTVSNQVVPGNPGEFTYAAEKTTPAVVHIKTKMETRQRQQQFSSPFDDFFGFGDPFGGGRRQQQQPQEASGSGVIISADGYIVTNNHVVAEAAEVTVILNDKREYKAKVISTDPSSDLAVIQIKETNLPFLNFGDSDALRVGEWVLAVGNPFNLESTVTAGIVSAKGRQNIIDRDSPDMNPLESFIQTDAAVNPGNSGGALVNLKGELIGINTAIYSRTGQFAGYSFAVPVSIVKKVSGDLIKYGNVQRGFLGVQISEVNAKLADEKDLKTSAGVYVGGFSENSAAKDAGIKINDVIIKIDGVETKSTSKLMEIVSRKRPGEPLQVTVNRDGATKEFKVTLKNKDGNTEIVKGDNSPESAKSEFLGAKFASLTPAEKKKFGVSSGVKIAEVLPDGRLEMYGLAKGSVITKINDKVINTPKEAVEALESRKGRIKLEGVDVDGSRFIYVL